MYPSFIFINQGSTTHKVAQSHIPNYQQMSQTPKNSYNSQMIPSNIKYGLQQCDLGLSQFGRKQALKIKTLINKMHHIDIVVVSPLLRALQTCDIIFGDQQHIKFYVQPLLCQRITTPASLGAKIRQSSITYGQKRFDFSKIPLQTQQRWYIDSVMTQQTRGRIFQLAQKQSKSLLQASLQLLRYGPLQSQKQLELRTKQLKKQLLKYKLNTHKKIAIVGHPKIIQAITATGSYLDGSPINGILLDCGEIKQIPIIIEGYQFHDTEVDNFCKLPFLSNK